VVDTLPLVRGHLEIPFKQRLAAAVVMREAVHFFSSMVRY
jgi:hypothetical protein